MTPTIATPKSTGPRTEAGKQRSRLNAFRHGLTGQISTMTPEDRAAYDRFRDTFLTNMGDLAPKTSVEEHLAHAIAADTWRLNRIRAIEENIFALAQSDPHCIVDHEHGGVRAALTTARAWKAEAKQLNLLSLYESRINRSLHKNLKTLRELQAERRKLESSQQKPAPRQFVFSTPRPPATELPAITQSARPEPRVIGFRY